MIPKIALLIVVVALFIWAGEAHKDGGDFSELSKL